MNEAERNALVDDLDDLVVQLVAEGDLFVAALVKRLSTDVVNKDVGAEYVDTGEFRSDVMAAAEDSLASVRTLIRNRVG